MSTPSERSDATGSSSATSWAAERERSNLWALRLMRWVAVAAGRPVARVALHPITLYFLIANVKARRASFAYLGRALGRTARWTDVYRHIFSFAATVLDRVYFLQERFDRFAMSDSGAEAINEPVERGEGLILVGAHLGSFEALRATAQGRGAPLAMLMYEDNARLINSTLRAIAPNADLKTIALGRAGAMLSLRRWLEEGGVAGLLADRTLATKSSSDRSRTMSLPFLGTPARFSDGPFRLAAMLKRRVVFMAGLYHGGNRYELRFLELADFRAIARANVDGEVRAALQRYVQQIESLCRETPFNWFNFFDFWADDADVQTPPSR